MAPRSAGCACTSAPRPSAQATSSRPQPTGTPSTKRIAWRRPWLAASAADSVVLGPGVKAMAVEKTSSAVSSGQGMGRCMGKSMAAV
jgi:hypothetical protein